MCRGSRGQFWEKDLIALLAQSPDDSLEDDGLPWAKHEHGFIS